MRFPTHADFGMNRTIHHKTGNLTTETHTVAMHKEVIEASRPGSTPGSAALSRVQSRSELSALSSGMHTPHPMHAPSSSSGVAPADLSRRLANVSLNAGTTGSGSNSAVASETPSPAPGTAQHIHTPEASGSGSRQIVVYPEEPQFQSLDHEDLPPEETHILINLAIRSSSLLFPS